jgi:hypothetical protein
LLRHAVLYHPSPTKLKGSSTSFLGVYC